MHDKYGNGYSGRFLTTISSICVVLFGICGPSETQATILYVDKDSPCPGAGTTGVPYCSIQNAFNMVNPGDTIRIRNAASPYDQNAKTTRSGTASSPIVLEPDVGNTPIIRYTGGGSQRAAIEIRDADYWIVRNLTFDGTGTFTSKFALWFQAATRNTAGNQIIGCTFRNWGGKESQNIVDANALFITNAGGTGWFPTGTLVKSNVFDGNRQASIKLGHDKNTVIDGNDIKNAQAGRVYDGSVHCLGIFAHDNGTGPIIRNNKIHDFQPFNTVTLTNQLQAVWAGIWADSNVDYGQTLNNRIYNIDQNKSTTSNPLGISQGSCGILIESRCDNWVVKQNVIYQIGQSGIRNGSESTGDPNYNQYINNAIYSCGRLGIDVRRGYSLTVKNNIFLDNGIAQISFESTAVSEGPHVINYNDYYGFAGGYKVGQWGSYVIFDFSGWKSQSKGDSNSKNTNPLFVNLSAGAEDFHLQSGSPCKGAGEFGVDMGAYPSGY